VVKSIILYSYMSIKKGAGLFFICTEDNTVLLVKRSETVSQPGTWGIPGGHLRKGETFTAGALREAREEVGTIPKGRAIDALKNAGAGWKYVVFVVDISLGEKHIWTAKIRLNHEHSDLKWFRLNNLPKNLHSAISIIKN